MMGVRNENEVELRQVDDSCQLHFAQFLQGMAPAVRRSVIELEIDSLLQNPQGRGRQCPKTDIRTHDVHMIGVREEE